MTSNDLIKQLIVSFNSDNRGAFITATREYIEREKRMKHNQIAKELEKALFDKSNSESTFGERRFKAPQVNLRVSGGIGSRPSLWYSMSSNVSY